MTDHVPGPRGVSRRGLLLGAAAAGGLVVGVGGTLGAEALTAAPAPPAEDPQDVVDLANAYPFYGPAGGPVEQVGITTPQQRYTVYMTFDLTTAQRTDLQSLLARWSGAIAQLMAGQPIGQVEPSRSSAVGGDTGEALGLGPASLTVTVGLGPKVFTDAYGLADQKPPLLRDLRQLPSDALDPALTGGDLSVQACADDPQVAYHAVRVLARIGRDAGAATTRWAVLGFGRASAGAGQSTPRNLLGFKDGTRNIKETADLDRFVWTADGPDWQRRGSYQVVRKIQMDIETWDTDRTSDQNRVFGRHKETGAPLTGRDEFDTPDFAAKDDGGTAVIDPTSHVALAAFENNGGLRILRRGFNYTDGINQVGLLDAGLLFVSYQNDPAHFETLQAKLGASDSLNEYITHIGSAVFFVPPAPAEGSYLAQPMFGA
jgi:deferrochelatase/peroxidase EfeB